MGLGSSKSMPLVKEEPISPEEWFSSIRTVMSLYRGSAILKAGRYFTTGVSSSSFPASASCMTATVV